LGEGLKGGEVYRIEFPDGHSEVWKWYWEPQIAAKDFQKLELFERLSQTPGYRGFEVARPISINGQLMKLEYRSGEVLNAIESGSLETILRAKYQEQTKATFEALRKEIPNLRENVSSGIAEYFDASGKKQIINLHGENILVDPKTLKMSIIDPE
jgi:hypothetical protein